MSLKFIEVKIEKKIMQKYLENKFKDKVQILEYKRLGTGWHGTGYSVRFKVKENEKKVVLRTLRPEGFSHDYFSDRAASFILQHELSNKVKNHNKSIDVGGYTPKGELVSIGDCKEFFQIVEFVEGREYVKDLIDIMKRGKLTKEDKDKALILSNYLVELHKEKYVPIGVTKEEKNALASSIYRRHLRDCIGHGEMLMGVIDTYPDNLKWTNRKEFSWIIGKAAELREELKDDYKRLARMHGDFHPANIIFKDKKMIVLDASREFFGDPADDFTSMALNYIWYAIQHKGNFSGPFKELFDIYWNNYMKKTKDYKIRKIAPIFIAFRYVVMAHPIFFDFQSDSVRRKLFNIIKNTLNSNEFNPANINEYIQ
ncbi:MAG: phosphotransferase [archaeon]